MMLFEEEKKAEEITRKESIGEKYGKAKQIASEILSVSSQVNTFAVARMLIIKILQEELLPIGLRQTNIPSQFIFVRFCFPSFYEDHY